MKIERLPVGIYAANCYIVYCEDTKEGIVIDPGGEGDTILERIKKLDLNIKYIILTHGHGDHIGGIIEVKNGTKAPILIHKGDEELLKDATKNLSSMMFTGKVQVIADKFVEDKEELKFGNHMIEIIHTPGHTPGGISIKIEENLFTGDTLFAGSIGRTDFPGGSYKQIIESIKEKLILYPDDTIVYPGHGPSSTIGREKASNPFIVE
ncbi:MBL fold metallo-hydrolase [Anaerosalibacter bizertensis]|uniref:MBL fold metallo-hydrolase n=1 Tax=Anaerosalibacter bizertensis TaxID=932217 RepID=A0A844FJ63_9FIRM|nr:MBL fold metallo-hydrolase [Anaerosalibacter bizertensis]MBV1817452.1 MBL fold metallo-hydrolase [Bacteroidales bacterium MSK.15.36]HHV27760.1 MBL fold metallo-hydrolase [Tissierellia bacterium]MBU5293394.1 MBL fold metallo-hydrolase [Anaerosalibacter bizertensis]MCB5559248.1 MBL fold metallo-hydrolase [Anaerosalibacter bizertensis]MCG4564036.1 MBL fold metallo-hydrolase [Anaerosalibacter bizertensis]